MSALGRVDRIDHTKFFFRTLRCEIEEMKETVVNDPPKSIKGIEFGILSAQEIVKESQVEITHRDIYDLEKGRVPKEHGAIDMRMVSDSGTNCMDGC